MNHGFAHLTLDGLISHELYLLILHPTPTLLEDHDEPLETLLLSLHEHLVRVTVLLLLDLPPTSILLQVRLHIGNQLTVVLEHLLVIELATLHHRGVETDCEFLLRRLRDGP